MYRRAELKALQEKEEAELAKQYRKPADTKVTRAMIELQREEERRKHVCTVHPLLYYSGDA